MYRIQYYMILKFKALIWPKLCMKISIKMTSKLWNIDNTTHTHTQYNIKKNSKILSKMKKESDKKMKVKLQMNANENQIDIIRYSSPTHTWYYYNHFNLVGFSIHLYLKIFVAILFWYGFEWFVYYAHQFSSDVLSLVQHQNCMTVNDLRENLKHRAHL